MPGEAYLVGAGPGDAGLMTVKGMELLRKADVVVYDELANHDLLDHVRPGAKLIDVGKQGGHHKVPQEGINEIIVNEARAGNMVVRLKGGDPFLFGRGGEEAEELRKAGIDVHVVPGITSAIAAPALAGIPVTHRDHAPMVTFVTGHERGDRPDERIDWGALARTGGTIVILMGMSKLEHNMSRLMEAGMDPATPVGVVHRGSTPQQRVVISTLREVVKDCRDQGVGSPSVVVVGDVVRCHHRLGDLR
ncbi:MAG: Uroporphyrinogen-III C-methyltransferase [Methanomassiliicoccales archaeon PtaU1.Bin030]|nr:MAG: Uroporphyrinogen-III C-methyltransferase [Methanomassiliicoccales archaeon PtaU1.Bin030]